MSNDSGMFEVFNHTGSGYAPLLFSSGWQVAVLNWELGMDLSHLHSMERHIHTDEVFILTRGRAALICRMGSEFTVIDMQSGVIYNIKSGIWHNLVASPDASMIIVENRDTHRTDVEIVPLESLELNRVKKAMPEWAVRSG
jgi:hypothetical protein